VSSTNTKGIRQEEERKGSESTRLREEILRIPERRFTTWAAARGEGIYAGGRQVSISAPVNAHRQTYSLVVPLPCDFSTQTVNWTSPVAGS
jgi:transcription elongation GreA/GreB family factor